MNRLSHFFLRAKHWKMFLLLFIVSVGRFVGSIAIMVASPSPEVSGLALVGLALLGGLLALVFLTYLWSVGSFLCSVTPPDLQSPLSFFRVAIIYPMVLVFAAASFSLIGNTWPFVVFVALGLFALVCSIYDINFVSKALAMAETGEPRALPEYAGTFFLFLFFFPLGVWFIQPRVNRIYDARAGRSNHGSDL
jgi:hypothetical protein